jgi:hypothetical protein
MKDFTAVANEIIDSGKLDAYQGWILVRIARRGVCFESQRSMADGTNISLTHVNRTMKWLQENGYIERKKDCQTGRIGWSIVSPQEQTQQNFVPPQEQGVLPEERSVLPQERFVPPQERHLNKTTIKRPIKKRERETNAFWAVPENLQNKDFLKWWKRWLEHVDQANLTFTETQAAIKLAALADAGSLAAIESLRMTLDRGWKNIHVLDTAVTGQSNGAARTPHRVEVPDGNGGTLVYIDGKLDKDATYGHNKQPTN